jgi:hypothetical protein
MGNFILNDWVLHLSAPVIVREIAGMVRESIGIVADIIAFVGI